MPTEHSLQVAGSLWTDKRTAHLMMIPELAMVFAEKLDEYKDALIFMSGAPSFEPDGVAWEEWVKIRDSLLK